MTSAIVICSRCGLKRLASKPRGYVCGACKSQMRRQYDPPNDRDGLPPEAGEWVREGLVWRWVGAVAHPPLPGRDELGHYLGAAECGTDAGYSKHRRLRNKVCEPCRSAHAEAQAERRRKAA